MPRRILITALLILTVSPLLWPARTPVRAQASVVLVDAFWQSTVITPIGYNKWHVTTTCDPYCYIGLGLKDGTANGPAVFGHVTISNVTGYLNRDGTSVLLDVSDAETCTAGTALYWNDTLTEPFTQFAAINSQRRVTLFAFRSRTNESPTFALDVEVTDTWSCSTGTPTPTFTPTATHTPTATYTPTLTPTPGPAPAGTCTTSWSIKHDFTQGAYNWEARRTPDEEATRTAVGWESVNAQVELGSETRSQRLVIERVFPRAIQLTSVTLDVTYNPGTDGTSGAAKQLLVLDISNLSSPYPLIDGGHPPSSGHRMLTWTNTRSGLTALQINIWASGIVGAGQPPNGDATVNSITLAGTGYNPDGVCTSSAPSTAETSWAYPLAPSEQIADAPMRSLANPGSPSRNADNAPFNYLTDGIPGGAPYDTTHQSTLMLARGMPNVHSMTAGTVDRVTLLEERATLCSPNLNPLHLVMPGYTCLFTTGGGIRQWALNYRSVALVVIRIDTTLLSYLVSDSQVTVGQTVSKGCILGKVVRFYAASVAVSFPPSGTLNFSLADDGYTIVQGRDTSGIPFDILPYLKETPQEVRCNATGGSGCTLVKNPAFTPANDGNWTSKTSTTPSNPVGEERGLLLNTAVYQFPAGLDATTQYTITVSAHLASGAAGRFTIQLGSHEPYTVNVTATASASTDFPAAHYLPLTDAGFMLVLDPGATTNVIVDFICIYDDDSGPPLASPCILNNPELDNADGWALGGTASIQDGLAYLADGDSISQNVVLSPKTSGAQGYTLTVLARRKGVPVTGDWFTITWGVTHTGGGAGGAFGPFADQLAFTNAHDDFSITAKDTYTVSLTAEANGTEGQQLQITRVCMETADGVDPPGYQKRPAITTSCAVCSYAPVGDLVVDVPELVQWLECSIAQIWHCQCKAILVGIWTVITQVLSFLGMLRLWLGATIAGFATWLGSTLQVVMRYFNGLFRNLGTDIVNAINYGPSSTTVIREAGGSGLFDFLVSLVTGIRDLGTTIVNGIVSVIRDVKEVLLLLIDTIFTLLVLIISLVVAILNLVVTFIFAVLGNLLAVAQIAIQSITAGFNAPTTAPLTLSCGEKDSGVYYACVVAYTLEQYVFSDPTVSTMVSIALGAMAFYLLVWTSEQLSGALS